MVGTKQQFGTCGFSGCDTATVGAVSPTLLGRVFLISVGAVGNEDVYTPDCIFNGPCFLVHKRLVFRVAIVAGLIDVLGRLMVACEEHRLTIGLDSVAEINHGMT